MLAKPIGERFLFDVSRGEHEHCGGGFGLVGPKIETVETEKNISRQKRRPLVSIDKRVVANNPGRVGRGETANISLAVGVQMRAIRRPAFPQRRRVRRPARRERLR
jgi:hypothetical protein